MTNKINSNLTPQSIVNQEEEIDIKKIFVVLWRRRFILSSITFLCLLFSYIYGATKTKIWQGEFQIVVDKKNSSASNLLASSSLRTLLPRGTSELQTEVKILESSSVLRPIYDFVKKEKTNMGINTSAWSYNNWLNGRLTFKLLKGTKILNVSYKDESKELILDVLSRISNTYQEYSKENTDKTISKAIKFLSTEVDNTRIKSENSLAQLHEFSLKYGLGERDGLIKPTQDLMLNGLNQDRNFSKQNTIIPKTNDFMNGSNERNPQNNILGQSDRYLSQYQLLSKLEAELVNKSAFFKDNSQIIINLKQRIDNINKSLSRPNQILMKYRNLKRNALRDENILIGLESQLRSFQLEEAKRTDPWQLITVPSLLDRPVSPKRKKLLTYGFLAGILIGSSIAFGLEVKMGE